MTKSLHKHYRSQWKEHSKRWVFSSSGYRKLAEMVRTVRMVRYYSKPSGKEKSYITLKKIIPIQFLLNILQHNYYIVVRVKYSVSQKNLPL